MRRRDLIAAAGALGGALATTGWGALAPRPAHAQGPAQGTALRIGLGGAFTTIDPHFYHAVPNHTVAMHMFERLINRAPDGRLIPGLATEWKPLSDTLWEFRLRPGVKFHDGGDFTADDVVFTFERARDVPNSPGGFGGFLRAVERVEVIDPLTIRLHTPVPAPDLGPNLTYVGIVSRRVGEGASTADYNSGKAAIGTGPYRFAGYTPGNRVELARHDAWWGGRPAWESVSLRLLSNPAGRTAALLSGDVDLIDTPSVSDLPRLREDERVSVKAIPGIRLIYLVPDLSREGESPFVTDAQGAPLPRNPFRDRRVREALSLALHREALGDRVMLGTGTPTNQWMPPGGYSYAPKVVPPQPDPARARRLLAEAGLPEGFRLTLHTPNDRYPNDARLAQAVAQMWTRIGVQTTVEAMPWSTYAARGGRQEFSMGLWGWGSATFEGGYMLSQCFATNSKERSLGLYNYGRYSDPALDAAIARAVSTVDEAERERLLVAATEQAMAETPIIPLLMLQNLWAVRQGIAFQPRSDERTLAMDATPA
ncbi:ABC transporter substrate-binding protein [Teichococcus aestuarii]|uniref:ABC transporter substrate-binding protein n=1 Tax=Teichococcus aestuarii TaxID=568898 RepID=A0A2U1V478_9PROT|nr:ABC transporter substrate-binding protein [Pseudoroseomonas aestuarii]PWC28661.1 ABC transporter substrate-binding protein [Pseudoroseomonas aestuarii]